MKAVVKRSEFESTPLKHVVQILNDYNWLLHEDVRKWCVNRWKILFQTQINEDGFQRMKTAMRQTQMHRVGREVLGYQTLIESDVLRMHNLREAEPRHEDVCRGATLPAGAFKPSLKDCSINTIGFVGTSSSVAWHHASAEGLHVSYADQALAREACAAEAWATVRLAWLGCFFSIKHSILARRRMEADFGFHVCCRKGP